MGQFILKHLFIPLILILKWPFILSLLFNSYLDVIISYCISGSQPVLVKSVTCLIETSAVVEPSIDKDTIPNTTSSDNTIQSTNTKRNKNNLNIQLPVNTAAIKRPFYSAHHPLDSSNDSLPHLLYSPTSSISSFNSHDEKRSKVEDLIYRFETGQHRRYSLDSYFNKKQYIKERKYEYQPLVFEWKKRIHDLPFQLKESRSTPIRMRVNIPPPIPEKSQSTWT